MGKTGSSRSRMVEIKIGRTFTKGGALILGTFAAALVLSALLPSWTNTHLILRPGLALGVKPYQLLTGPLFNESLSQSSFSLAFLALLLWSIGSAVEPRLGTWRFLLWGALSSVGAAVSASILGRLWPGHAADSVPIDTGPICMLVLVAFSYYYGSLRVKMWGLSDPVSGRVLSYFFITISLLMHIWGRQYLVFVGNLASVGVSNLLLRVHWRSLFRRKGASRPFRVLRGGATLQTPASDGDPPKTWLH
jgi:membrane associated rhomboid family serine protease